MKQAKKNIKSFIQKVFSKVMAGLAATPSGGRFLTDIFQDLPKLCIEAFGKRSNLSQRFKNVSCWPDEVSHFEDLSFLFSSTPLNMGIVHLCFDEAAYLYKLVKSLKKSQLVEIGRFKGGGTFLMAAAMDGDSHLRSYDLHVKMPHEFKGASLDADLQDALRRYGLRDKVDIVVGNSHRVDIGSGAINLLFVDGDHTYEGVRKDFLHWQRAIRPGGHLLFHDAAKGREFSTYHEGVGQVIQEVENKFSDYFTKISTVGSLVHFQRTQVPFRENSTETGISIGRERCDA